MTVNAFLHCQIDLRDSSYEVKDETDEEVDPDWIPPKKTKKGKKMPRKQEHPRKLSSGWKRSR